MRRRDRSVDARELRAFMGVETKFPDWITRRVRDYKFLENKDFVVSLRKEKNSGRGRSAKEYAITIAMAKELAMIERNDAGAAARAYFIECEWKLKARPTTGAKQLESRGTGRQKKCNRSSATRRSR